MLKENENFIKIKQTAFAKNLFVKDYPLHGIKFQKNYALKNEN